MSSENSPPKAADVEQNVIPVIPSDTPPTSDNNTAAQIPDSPPATTRTPSRSPPPGTINMSGLRTTLPDIALNSPSTNIIGTPFAHTASNTPFEYPFPDTPSTDSASPPPSHPSFRPGSPHGNSYHPQPHPNFHPPPPLPPPADIHHSNPPGTAPPATTTFNLVHPKFRAPSPATPPPMPPSLKKKRWSLNILGRKRTSNPSTPPGENPALPAGSPPVVISGAILGGLGSGRPNRASIGGGDPHRSIEKA